MNVVTISVTILIVNSRIEDNKGLIEDSDLISDYDFYRSVYSLDTQSQ